jgi:hypothetical protein
MILPAGAAPAAIGSSRTTAAIRMCNAFIWNLLWSLPNERLDFSIFRLL